MAEGLIETDHVHRHTINVPESELVGPQNDFVILNPYIDFVQYIMSLPWRIISEEALQEKLQSSSQTGRPIWIADFIPEAPEPAEQLPPTPESKPPSREESQLFARFARAEPLVPVEAGCIDMKLEGIRSLFGFLSFAAAFIEKDEMLQDYLRLSEWNQDWTGKHSDIDFVAVKPGYDVRNFAAPKR
ncbi:MAG: hypothetical protein NZM42_07700 [Gemmatales bacterium]|nr:hypothetical protein [Gemmatales bacterium]